MAALEENGKDFKLEFVCKALESHREKIYSVSFFDYGEDSTNNIFATVSSNHAAIYELNKSSGKILCLQTYLDEAWDESFYCVRFAVDKQTSAPLLIIAGELGVIKILNCNTQKIKRAIIAHGYRINYLLNHPFDDNIVISCSDDQSLKIWNIETAHCLAIICGHDGHRAAVLGCDIHSNGQLFISCGQDHAIKIWQLNDIKARIQQSYDIPKNHENVNQRKNAQNCTKIIQFPVYSRQKIHTKFMDHICWYNNLIFSKSTESLIKIWMPPIDDFEKSIKTIGELRYKNGESYFMRFDIDYIHNLIAMGDSKGNIYIFELDKYFSLNANELNDKKEKEENENKYESDDKHWHTLLKPKFVSRYKPIILDLPECNAPIRGIKFNRLGDLVAVSDNGTIYRYRKIISQD